MTSTIDEIPLTAIKDEEASGNLPVRKRKGNGGGETSSDDGQDLKKIRTDPEGNVTEGAGGDEADEDADLKPLKRNQPLSKAREVRLEQNRKAARESRRRKKVLIEELQRSVIFFSRANGTLKQQNEELQRMLVQARTQAQVINSQSHSQLTLQQPAPVAEKQEGEQVNRQDSQKQQTQGIDMKEKANLQALAAVQAQASLQQLQNSQQQVSSGGGVNPMANWMNFQAAMAGGAMGLDPNNVYAQALNQIALQQAAAAQNQSQSQAPGVAAPSQLQLPFGMSAAHMGMQLPFGGGNPFQLQQFAAAAGNPAAAAQWHAANNASSQGSSASNPGN